MSMTKQIEKDEKTVEEIVEEYREKFLSATGTREEDGIQLYCSRCSDDESFYDWLTQTLQAERQRCDEMVEAERERIKGILFEHMEYSEEFDRYVVRRNIVAEALTQPQ